MRWRLVWRVLIGCFVLSFACKAQTARVLKVLPEFVDEKGRNALHPSLYERDAYQEFLRQHIDKRAGIRFYVHWKPKGPSFETLKLRVELRGIAHGNLPRQLTMERPLDTQSSHWTVLDLIGQDYRNFGEVTAWHVTLWDGDQLQSEQKSFLW